MWKVLIVDDAPFMRSVIRDILHSSGRYEVVAEATHGREAVTYFRMLNPDLVIMDIVMPEMDGIEAMKQILKHQPHAKVIMCSALGQEPLVVESMSSGAKDFIVKPFSPEKVLRVLDQVAGK